MRRHFNVLLAILLVVISTQIAFAQLASSPWPAFRRDSGNSGLSPYGGSGSDLSWVFTAGGIINSAPVIGTDGTAYVTSSDGYVYAVAGNGTEKWKKSCACTGAYSPAIASDGTLYVPGDAIYALKSSDGTLKSKIVLSGGKPSTSINIGIDGTVYVGCADYKLYAYKSTGTLLNSAKLTFINSAPAVTSDGTIYVPCLDGLYALNSSLSQKWKFAPGGSFSAAPAVGPDGFIYIGTTSGVFYSVNPSTGKLKWLAYAGGAIKSSAAVFYNTSTTNYSVYFGCEDYKVYAVSSTTGAKLWTFSAGHYVDSAITVGVDGGIYAGSLDSNVYSLNSDGTERWHYDTGSAIYSSPSIGPGGALYIGSGNFLYCFAADTTPPGEPTVTDDGIYTASTSQLHASWNASDQESGILSYDYCVGTAPGLDDVAAWQSAGSAVQQTRTGLALLDKHTYYISVRATNGAGLVGSVGSSDGITVDATPPAKPVVTDDGAYTEDHTKIHASWSSSDAESGIAKYEYSIGTTPGAADVVAWKDAAFATSATETGLSLQQGAVYYVNVRAYNNLGVASDIGSSDGILVDSVSPSAPTVSDDGAYTSSITSLHAAWAAVTCASGVASYEYSIGTSSGSADIENWTSVALNTQVTISGLSLKQGQTYYINVRARNSLGKAGNVGSSDGITVDTTAPSAPIVLRSAAYTGSYREIAASWSSSDAESGISEYIYSVGSTPGAVDVLSWKSAGTQASLTIASLFLIDGHTYYVSVKAKNGAGIESPVGTSAGITVDLSKPSTPVVIDDGNYTIDASKLHAKWNSSDAQSGIIKYEYCVGTSAGANDVMDWSDGGTSTEKTITGLNLQSGQKYYVSVRSTNGANMVSDVGSSDGIYVESTPPTTPVVTDDGKATSSLTTLHASWTSDDPETGIGAYEYSIGTSAGLTDVVNWTSAGTNTSVQRDDLSLAQGVTYYFNVRATNGIGLVSNVGSSDGITVDTTAPSQTVVTDDGDYTSDKTMIHVTADSTDDQSGISFYEYAIGTISGGTDILSWTKGDDSPDITISDLSLSDGIKYYVSVRATNGVGIAGKAGVSDGITVDSTPPVSVSVVDDGEYFCSDSSLHGKWSASDPESGIKGYKYCIGTQPGANDVADWLDVGSVTEDTRTGLSLSDGQTYYISVIAANNAGGESASASSDGIKLDLTAPSTPVVTDTGKYWGYKTSISANWQSSDAESGISEYEMSVGTSAGATDVAPWLNVGNSTSYTRKGILLSDGVTYYVNIRAKNGAGKWSDVGSSDGVLVDSTPPTTPVVTDDGDTTSVLDRLHATWHSEDPESGIAEYMYCIGTSPGAVDVVGWTSAGLKEDVTVTNLKLDPLLRYYFSVKARSNAGAWSAVSASDGIGYSTGAAIWWKFRNDASNAGRALFAGTTVNDSAWTIATEGWVESSPAISSDGTAYIGSGDGKLYAITQNGTLTWTYDTGASIDSSPAIAPDGKILFGNAAGTLYCLTQGGELVWKYQAAGGFRSSPLVCEDVVYIGCLDKSVYAVDYLTGIQKWAYKTKGEVRSSPAIDTTRNAVYFASGDYYIYALDTTGKLKWKFLTGSAPDASPAVAADGTVYIGSGDAKFYAINPDGSQKWSFDVQNIADSSPAIDLDGNIYFGTGLDGGGSGQMYALKPDGTELWHKDMAAGIISSPAIDSSGRIFVGSCDGNMYAFNSDGSICWKFATLSTVASSPAIGADSSVIFGSYDGNIYCLRDVSSKDLTPPLTPVVVVPDAVVKSGEPFTASYSSVDPDSMVSEYTYAIGTAPGLCDVVGWTSSGIETSFSRDDLSLKVGQTYYVSVKARNPSQRWSNTGVSSGVTVVSSDSGNSLGDVKTLDDGDTIYLKGETVTAVFDGCFFIEEQSRCAGIRCIQSGTSVNSGEIVDIIGVVSTLNGERVINVTQVTNNSSVASESAIKPIGLCGRAIYIGKPDPLGLYVRIWGKVADIGSGYVLIDDGSNIASYDGKAGIVATYPGTSLNVGDTVYATGIICHEVVDEDIVTMLRTTSENGIVLVN